MYLKSSRQGVHQLNTEAEPNQWSHVASRHCETNITLVNMWIGGLSLLTGRCEADFDPPLLVVNFDSIERKHLPDQS